MKKSIFAVLLVIWMAFIFSMSSQNSEVSSNTSGGTIKMILSATPKFTEQPEEVQENVVENLQFITRKSAHFIEYMILSILVTNVVNLYLNKKRSILITVIFVFLYACSDEFHQLFVQGRQGSFRDVLIDTAGGIAAVIVKMLYNMFLKKR